MGRESRWQAARVEHDAAIDVFVSTIERIPPDRWHRPPAQGKWSPAEVSLHVIRSYELGTEAIAGSPGMRLQVPIAAAWFSRTVLLPVLFALRTFPGGARSPREVVPSPDEARALDVRAAVDRLRGASANAARALRDADDRRPRPRVTHAYFGPLPPLDVLRLLGAHTRHHARGFARLA